MKKQYRYLNLFLVAIMMIAAFAFVPLGGRASAETPDPPATEEPETPAKEPKNLFDTLLFATGAEYSDGLEITRQSEYGIEFKFSEKIGNYDYRYMDVSIYLDKGIYTLSAEFEMLGAQSFPIRVVLNTHRAGVLDESIVVDYNENTQNIKKSETFTVISARQYWLSIRVYDDGTLPNSNRYELRNIQIEKGTEATAFVPFGVIQKEVEIPINEDAKNIIAKLEELFGAESGIIAGASVGTFVVLCLVAILMIRKR